MGKRSKPGERSMVRSFSYPEKMEEMLEDIMIAARREHTSLSEIIQEGLKDWHLKHSKSNNPQMTLEESPYAALPHLLTVLEEGGQHRLRGILQKTSKNDWKDIKIAGNIWLFEINKEDTRRQ